MAVMGLLNYLQRLWPFSVLKVNDLKASEKLVKNISIPEHTKQFVFAIQDPQTGALVYILTAQNLSERSARDAEYLIKEVCPDAVFVQRGPTLMDAHLQEFELMYEGGNEDPVPTSTFGVLKRCFTSRLSKEEYDYIAGNLVLREIFGVGSFGHLLTAKIAAKEVGSSFFTVESFRVNPGSNGADKSYESGLCSSSVHALEFQPGGSSVQSLRSTFSSNLKRFFASSNIHTELLRPLALYADLPLANVGSYGSSSDSVEPKSDYEPPPFAQPIYPLLLDLHNIFADIPSIGRALAYAQKMFHNVGQGGSINAQILSEIHIFQIAVEGLRVALNSTGRLSMNKIRNSVSEMTQFSDLSSEEKSQCLIAQALRSQTRNFKIAVAVIDAGELAGIRKYWNTSVPPEVEDTLKDLVLSNEIDVEISNGRESKGLLANKPALALGAGATTVLGASSLCKVVPASTVVQIIILNVPTSLKLFLAQTHKAIGIAVCKILGPLKVVAPGFAGSGAKASTIWNASSSARKIRAVTHSVITSAEKTSFSAMRTAFYEIMRKRKVQSVGFLPWAMFGCSITTCAGLLVYGDGIECAVVSLPSAPAIASLGRGIQNLQQTSQAVGQSGRTRIQKAMESLTYGFRKSKTW